MKILIIDPKRVQDYSDETNWMGSSDLMHLMQTGGFWNDNLFWM